MQCKQKKNPSAFLRNTHNILAMEQLAPIVGWTSDGLAFEIRDLPRFEAEVLPFYFKHHKFSSFVRQLNMYGFHKLRYSQHENTFQHEKFRRELDTLTDIKRKPEKKKKVKLLTGSEQCVRQDTLPQHTPTSQQQEEAAEPSIEEKEQLEPPTFSANEFTAQDECCVRLCELLLVQNRILSKHHLQFRQVVLDYKRRDIETQSSSIKTLQKILYEGDDATINSEITEHPTHFIVGNLQRLSERHREQASFLAQLSAELNSLTRQLINTNYSMFSTTSIEEGYSTLRIEDGRL